MFEKMVGNRYLVCAQSWVMLSLGALALCAGCTRDEEVEVNTYSHCLTVETVETSSVSDWITRSKDNSDDKAVYVKLGDSLVLYAQVEPLGVDTTEVLTRGIPIMNVNDLSDIRMNLYVSSGANWTTSTPVTEQMKVSRSGKVYITSPSYNWQSRTDKVTLLTYTPLPSVTANGLTEGANGNTVKYTVPTDVTKQPDFCTTIASIDVVNSDGMKHIRKLTLSHQLTAVGFALNGWNVKVSKIEITGVSFVGSYALNSSTWSGNTIGSDSRSLGVNTSKMPVDSYQDPIVWTDITRSNGYLMMVPQTLTDKAKVNITYTDAAGKEQVITAMLQEMSSGKWVAGDKITYCIQLETAPSLGTDPISLYMPWKAGYTTSAPIPFVTRDPQDRYTFNWDEEWNIIYRGQTKVNNLSGGAASGWYTGSTNTIPIWFFTKESNPSISSSRSSVVTLDAWRTVDRTFTVVQGMKPHISVEGMPSAGTLIPIKGMTTTVTVKSNYPWESIVNQIKLNPSSGEANMSGQRVEVTFYMGTIYYESISAIFKTTNDNKEPDLITSTSYAYNRKIDLNVRPSTPGVIVPGVGGSYVVHMSVPNGITWTSNPSTGVTVSPARGIGSNSVATKVTITVAGNPSYELNRDLKVDFTAGGNGEDTWSGVQSTKLGLEWAEGNLVADGANGAKIGKPTDYGLYFKTGSLFGFSQENLAVSPALEVSPNAYTGPSVTCKTCKSWKTTQNPLTATDAEITKEGLGDPCRYYLGRQWRLPTYEEMVSLFGTNGSNVRYSGNVIKIVSSDLIFVRSGFIHYPDTTPEGIINGRKVSLFYTSSTMPEAGYVYSFNLVFMKTSTSYAAPIRCVRLWE